VAISGTIPAISHVAVTVTDLSVSEAWYTRVFGVQPILDEDTGPFRHIVYQLGGTLFGLHGTASAPAPAARKWWPMRAGEAPSSTRRRAVSR
jgi:catechol 2,3-dioxygenase-like lactoylglutathione lyase family enzyme